VLCPIVVGRETELEQIAGALASTRDGRGGLIFITGEAGIGKSRLAGEATVSAERLGMATLWGRTSGASASAPFRPIAQALLSAFRGNPPPSDPTLDPYRPYLGRLVPEWAMGEAPPETLALVGEALLRLLGMMSAGFGTLLVLEDLHSADPETLAVIEYVAENLHSEPVLLVGTTRSEHATSAGSLARFLETRGVATVMSLERINSQEVERMASACLATDAVPATLRETLQESSEGVPFLVEELLAAWATSGVLTEDASGWNIAASPEAVVPLTFDETVAARVEPLSPAARDVLDTAALVGRRFEWPLLPDITALDERTVLNALHAGVDAHLLEADRGRTPFGFRFRHALTREAIMSAISTSDRRRLVSRGRAVLEARYPGLPGEWCELAAQLAEQADERAHAARLFTECGRRAIVRGALESAEAALRRALHLAGDDNELAASCGESLVETLALAGQLDPAISVAEDVLQIPGARRVAVHLYLARAALAAERWEVASENIASARSSDDGSSAAAIDAVAAQTALGEGNPQYATALAQAALNSARDEGLYEVACEALEVLGRCARLRDLVEARHVFDEAVALATQHDLGVWKLRALAERATIDLLDRSDVTLLLQARALAERTGAIRLATVLDIQLGSHKEAVVRPHELIEVADRAADVARRLRLEGILPMALIWKSTALGHLHGRTSLEPLMTEAIDIAGGAPHVVASASAARALIALRDNDLEDALRQADACEQAARREPATSPWAGRGLRGLLRTLRDPTNPEPRDQLRASRATVYFGNRAALAAADAVAAGRRGDRDAAEEHFARAEEIASVSKWQLNLFRRLVAESAFRDGWGDPVAWLTEAADFFASTGYDEPLYAACRSLLQQIQGPAND